MKSVMVKSVRKISRPDYVGDIGVVDNHNLFISNSISDKSVLVHNCWGIISKDPAVGKAFQVGKNCRIQYRLNPTKENKEKTELYGDIHKINYNSFTGIPVTEITKEQRQESKGITFGSIYGMSIRSLAASINQTVEYSQKIYDAFFAKFKRAAQWLGWTVSFSERNLYVYSPIGRRRNLSGHLAGSQFVSAALGRRAKNSPIQGMASDFGFIAARLMCEKFYEFSRQIKLINMQRDQNLPLLTVGINVMVHDSIEVEAPYELVGPALHIMEWCATVGVREYVKSVYNMDFIVGLEVDFDLGASGDKLRKWDFTDDSLREVVTSALTDQRDILGYDVDVEKTLRQILRSKSKYQTHLDSMQLDLVEINE